MKICNMVDSSVLGLGKVLGVWDVDLFHGELITRPYIKIQVDSVDEPSALLHVPHNGESPPQLTLGQVVGGVTLWHIKGLKKY